jgi:hypothetical protein
MWGWCGRRGGLRARERLIKSLERCLATWETQISLQE